MKILAMDTAAAACSVAIWVEGTIVAHEFRAMARGHAAELLPMVDRLLQQTGMKIEDFDALAVSVGPGAFTGLRIGLACARGFGVASGLPVIAVTTLEALSEAVLDRDGPVLCALDAKRSDLYAQVFDAKGEPITDAVAKLPQDVVDMVDESVTKVLVAGDCFERLKDLFGQKNIQAIQTEALLPDAKYVAQIAAARGLPEEGEARPSAFYIRPPDAALPKNGGRLRP